MPASEANKKLSDLFDTAAKILDLKGGNKFKSIAFQKVADLLDGMSDDIRAIHAQGGVKGVEAIKGIGQSSAAIIAEWLETGRSTDYQELATSIPPGLIEMLGIGGMGPKTVQLVWRERDITSIDQLARATQDGTLDGLKGIGKKKIEQIRQGIELLAKGNERRSLGAAIKIAAGFLEQLRALDGVERAEACGSVRRGKETIGDLDFLVVPTKDGRSGEILTAFTEFPQVDRILGRGENKSSVVTHEGLQVDCKVVPKTSFGAAYLYFTGSKDHNVRLRTMAQAKGHTLNDWGLYEQAAWDNRRQKPGHAPDVKAVAGASEEEVYKWFGFPWIAPELREDRGEIEAAKEGKLPSLITIDDYRGDLHTHTKASDGMGTIEQMAQAAMALGYKFLAITDHSKSQAQANGLDAKRLLAHIAAIHKVNDQIKGIELLAGSEVDILADGSLDYEDAVLAELDWVVASPHHALRQETRKGTDRLLRAIENPYVNVIGHPTGRLVNGRAGLPLDFAPIFKHAAATGTALEINASYQRLDLNDVHARGAIEAGCMLCINTDAHQPAGLGKLAGGIGTARRAWVEKKHVVNCMSLGQVRKFVAGKRE